MAGVLPAVVVFAPAHWLAGAVARATGGQVQLLDNAPGLRVQVLLPPG